VKINGVQHYLWRAVDHEGEVLEFYVTKTRDKQAALTFLKKAIKRYGARRKVITDRLRSYGAAMKEIGNKDRQEVGRHLNNRADNSHLPIKPADAAPKPSSIYAKSSIPPSGGLAERSACRAPPSNKKPARQTTIIRCAPGFFRTENLVVSRTRPLDAAYGFELN